MSQTGAGRLLTFVELDGFSQDWSGLGLGSDDLLELQSEIMEHPQRAPVVPGTGGLRKVRFAPASWHRGKRGAVRVCYVAFDEFGVVLLVVAYAKNEQDDLSQQSKRAIRLLIQRERKALIERATRAMRRRQS